MVYTSENFDRNTDFAANFLAGLLTQNYTKKSECRNESLSQGLNSVNFLKITFLWNMFPQVLSNFWGTGTPNEYLNNLSQIFINLRLKAFVWAPTTQHEFFLWICGTLRFFPSKLQNLISVEMSENDTDIETVQSITTTPETMQVIFHPSDSISEWVLGTESLILSGV